MVWPCGSIYLQGMSVLQKKSQFFYVRKRTFLNELRCHIFVYEDMSMLKWNFLQVLDTIICFEGWYRYQQRVA